MEIDSALERLGRVVGQFRFDQILLSPHLQPLGQSLIPDCECHCKQEFGLPTEPWLFTVRADGTIAARLEGSIGLQAFENAIKAAL